MLGLGFNITVCADRKKNKHHTVDEVDRKTNDKHHSVDDADRKKD